MTDRHPLDAYLSPPCTARVIGDWLRPRIEARINDWAPRLDPFAAAGKLLRWSRRDDDMDSVYDGAFELDARWERELRANVHPLNMRLGRDSFTLDWIVEPLTSRVR